MLVSGRNILIIGGSGALGNAIVLKLLSKGFFLHVICLPGMNVVKNVNVKLYFCNRFDLDKFSNILVAMTEESGGWDAIIDLIPYSDACSRFLFNFTCNNCKRYLIISTALMSGTNSSNCKYVDSKRTISEYWHGLNFEGWTIFKTYHHLGRYTGLGCCRPYNRSKVLISRALKGSSLVFYGSPFTKMSFINTNDVANVIYYTLFNSKTYKREFDLVSNEIVTHGKYIDTLLKKLDSNSKVSWLEKEGVSSDFWSFTDFEQIINSSELSNLIEYNDYSSLEISLEQAIEFPSFICDGSIDDRIMNQAVLP